MGPVVEPTLSFKEFPPSQLEYPILSSVNSYEWISEESDSPIPPDQNIILWDRSQDPPLSVGSYVEMGEITELILNSAVYQGNVETLSL